VAGRNGRQNSRRSAAAACSIDTDRRMLMSPSAGWTGDARERLAPTARSLAYKFRPPPTYWCQNPSNPPYPFPCPRLARLCHSRHPHQHLKHTLVVGLSPSPPHKMKVATVVTVALALASSASAAVVPSARHVPCAAEPMPMAPHPAMPEHVPAPAPWHLTPQWHPTIPESSHGHRPPPPFLESAQRPRRCPMAARCGHVAAADGDHRVACRGRKHTCSRPLSGKRRAR